MYLPVVTYLSNASWALASGCWLILLSISSNNLIRLALITYKSVVDVTIVLLLITLSQDTLWALISLSKLSTLKSLEIVMLVVMWIIILH